MPVFPFHKLAFACRRLLSLPNGHVSRETEVLGLENFISARVVEDCLGMNTGLVRECTISPVGHMR